MPHIPSPLQSRATAFPLGVPSSLIPGADNSPTQAHLPHSPANPQGPPLSPSPQKSSRYLTHSSAPWAWSPQGWRRLVFPMTFGSGDSRRRMQATRGPSARKMVTQDIRCGTDPVIQQDQEETRDSERGQWVTCVPSPGDASCELGQMFLSPPERHGDSLASKKSTTGHTHAHMHNYIYAYMHNSCIYTYTYT